MKKIKSFIIFSLIISMFFSIIGFAEIVDVQIISIGLQYNTSETRKPLVEIKSETTFEFGEIKDDAYAKYFDLDVDSFTFDIDNKYHAALGPFVSYNASKDYMTINNINGYVVKNTAYYVYVGDFDSESAAREKVNQLNGGILVVPNDQLVIMKNNATFFAYDSSTGDYVVTHKDSHMLDHVATFADMSYRGGFGAKRKNTTDITLINYLYMHEYLYGVVPREMSKDWPIEALKAQAIVARNFACANMTKFMDYGFNLDNTVNSQVYGGYGYEGEISNQAVDETENLTLLHENSLVQAYYHSNSGGYTENSENVWSAALPYLKGRYDPFSLGAPNDEWTLEYDKSFIESKLNGLGYAIGSLKDFYISDYTDNNRVFEASFIGTNKTVQLSKQTIRAAFGYNTIKSTLLTVEPDNALVITDGGSFTKSRPAGLKLLSSNGLEDVGSSLVVYDGNSKSDVSLQAQSYTIVGKGWGHGLGMSQWGAKAMADQGFTFEDILTYYYADTYIE